MSSSSIALSFAKVLYEDMCDAGRNVKDLKNVTPGCMTPAHRFTSDTTVFECTRYTVSNKVLSFSPAASKTQLDAMAKAREEQARKRARLQ
jgi:hypothetical protein